MSKLPPECDPVMAEAVPWTVDIRHVRKLPLALDRPDVVDMGGGAVLARDHRGDLRWLACRRRRRAFDRISADVLD
ncbi:MAG: hypothetical protein WAV27_10350 [Xanthobacteraceae bacterium]